MRFLCVLAAILVLTCSGSAQASILIQFDDGAEDSSIGSYYAGLGVEFTNTSWDTNLNLPGSSGSLSIRATDNGGLTNRYSYLQPNAVIATFAAGVTSISIDALDVGDNGIRAEVYDSVVGGNVIDFVEFFQPGFGAGNIDTISFSSVIPIHRIEIYQVQNISDDGIVLDNLSFSSSSAVPEPSTLGVWAALSAVAIVVGRRQWKHKSV